MHPDIQLILSVIAVFAAFIGVGLLIRRFFGGRAPIDPFRIVEAPPLPGILFEDCSDDGSVDIHFDDILDDPVHRNVVEDILQVLDIVRGRILAEEEGLVTAGAYWYDASGACVGWGDLSVTEMRTIAELLPEGQKLILVPQRRVVGMPFSDRATLDLAWLSQHCEVVIEADRSYYVDDHVWGKGRLRTVFHGEPFMTLLRDEVETVLRDRRC